MRALKIFGMVLGGVVALLVLGLVALWLLFDPNDYKDRITAAVRESTGRTLSLPGKLKLSVFPWLAVETGEASLGNPEGFGDEPFLTLKRASMSVKLMPLLHSQFEVGRVEIDGLDLKLRQNAAGKGNWEDWGKPSEPSSAESSAPTSLNLAGVQIADARIAFEDLVAQGVNVTIGRIAPGAAIPVELKLDLVSSPGARPMPLSAAFELTADLEKQHYRLAKLALRGNLQPEGRAEVTRLAVRVSRGGAGPCRADPGANHIRRAVRRREACGRHRRQQAHRCAGARMAASSWRSWRRAT